MADRLVKISHALISAGIGVPLVLTFLTIGANLVLPADSGFADTMGDFLPPTVTWFSFPVVVAGGIIGACALVLSFIQFQAKTAGRAALGVALVLFVLLMFWPGRFVDRQSSPDSSAVAQLRTISTAEVVYVQSSGGRFGSIADLIKEGLLDERFGRGDLNGYSFAVIADQAGYTATATPLSSNSPRGMYGYYSTSDAVVRYSTNPLLAPKDLSGSPVG
jgi:hypothetical protein